MDYHFFFYYYYYNLLRSENVCTFVSQVSNGYIYCYFFFYYYYYFNYYYYYFIEPLQATVAYLLSLYELILCN